VQKVGKKMESRLQAKKLGYIIRYVRHEVIADYIATYNVESSGKHIVTNAAKNLKIPFNEIWISEMWRPYEEYILFHELRQIHYRGKGLDPKNAHEKTIEDQLKRWKDEAEFRRMVAEIKEMDEKTAKKKRED
jgi:hypothetical protein